MKYTMIYYKLFQVIGCPSNNSNNNYQLASRRLLEIDWKSIFPDSTNVKWRKWRDLKSHYLLHSATSFEKKTKSDVFSFYWSHISLQWIQGNIVLLLPYIKKSMNTLWFPFMKIKVLNVINLRTIKVTTNLSCLTMKESCFLWLGQEINLLEWNCTVSC